MNWLIRELRLLAFLQSPGDIEPEELWRTVVGEEPESVSKRRGSSHRIEGEIPTGDGVLTLAPSGRLGFEVSRLPDNLLAWEEIPVDLHRRMLDALEGVPVQRLALAGDLLFQCSDKKEGYRTLASLLEGAAAIDPDNMSDFSLQINRRLPIGSMIVNRICKWSVAEVVLSTLPDNLVLDNLFFARIEFDVNNKSIEPPDSLANLQARYDELYGVVERIRETGTNDW